MVEVYDDRVEISNPGGLLLAVQKEFGTKSMSRNPLIFGLFTRMSLVERVASGIPRMRDEMREAGLPEPVFSTDGGFFTVTFRRPQKDDIVDSNDDPIKTKNDPVSDPVKSKNDPVNLEEAILNLVNEKEGMSAPEISQLIGKSLKTAKRYLSKLRESNKIEFRGAPKTGGYYIKTDDN